MAAPLLFVGPTQINLQTPWQANVTNGRVTARVDLDGVRSDPIQLPLASTSEFVGVYQINATVPSGVAGGDAVTLVVEAGGRQGSGDVRIAVRPGRAMKPGIVRAVTE